MSGSDLDQDLARDHVSCIDPCQESSSNAQINVNTPEDQSNALNTTQDEDNERDSDTRTPDFRQGGVSSTPLCRAPVVVDDFFRNFLVQYQMHETLECFEQEWYLLNERGVVTEQRRAIHEQYQLNTHLEAQSLELKRETEELQRGLEREIEAKTKLKKERDLHRMHHKRVTQEKSKLSEEIKRLRVQLANQTPLADDLKKKYHTEMKRAAMITLERDKLQKQLEDTQNSALEPQETLQTKKERTPITKTAATFTLEKRHNFNNVEDFAPLPVSCLNKHVSCKAHSKSVSNLALHPSKPVLVTVSDDFTWKMWRLPEGQIMMSGEGHEDWIAGVDFHPDGNSLATGSGDGTIKLWNFQEQKCVHTFHEHQAIWSVKFHERGEVLASGSLDNVAKLWDLIAQKCKTNFRGHTGSVNEVAWQPFSNTLCTASSDKTLSLWNARNGLCNATFCGHCTSVNHCTFTSDGLRLASCDAEGVVKFWDARMVREIWTVKGGPVPANRCAFDRSGKVLLVGFEDGMLKAFNTTTSEVVHSFQSQESSVQGLVCDHTNEFVITAGSDTTFKYWYSEQTDNKHF